MKNGTCPRTPERTAEGQHRDTNNNDNNDNNIYLILFNKYKEKICGKKFGDKVKIVNQCKEEEQYSKLTDDTQLKLTADLMAIK